MGMYIFTRMFYHIYKARKLPKIPFWQMNSSHHYCLPWDLDTFLELNNGRTLTLFDMGRTILGERTGFSATLRKHRFGLAVAGASVRYRKRITVFQKLEMRTRALGYDDKFIYMEQTMWNAKGECCNHLLVRAAVLKHKRMVDPIELLEKIDPDIKSPELPEWAKAWVEAEAQRIWPPMQNEGI